jgi:hypothetical protein
MVTLKNVLGIVGLLMIALYWTFIVNVWGALFVGALIVLTVVVLRRQQRRKRPGPKPESDDAMR